MNQSIHTLPQDARSLERDSFSNAARGLAGEFWPRSPLLWMTAFWILLYVIRPWEALFPQLAALQVERMYCSLVLVYATVSGLLRLDLSRQTVAALSLFAAFYVSSALGINPARGAESIYKLLVHIAMYLIIISSLRRVEDLPFLAFAYVLAVGLYLGKAEWEYFIHGRHQWSMGVPRLLGIDLTYRHPNGVGASTVLSLPFWYFLWRLRLDLFTPAVRYHRFLLLGLKIYPVIAVVAVLLTNSRGSMLGLLVFGFLSAVGNDFSPKLIKRLLIVGVAAFLFLLFLIPETQRERLTTLWDDDAGSTSAHNSAESRLAGAKAGWQMFQRFPLAGVGTGTLQQYRPIIDGAHQEAHNLYGQLLGEFGVIGASAFAFFVLSIFANLRRAGIAVQDSEEGDGSLIDNFALAVRDSLLLLCFFGLGSTNYHRFNWYFLAALAAAAATIAWTMNTGDRESEVDEVSTEAFA